jgi:3-deoxy-D-manno-octulosonic acid (KDO) 8-phosphate synthase
VLYAYICPVTSNNGVHFALHDTPNRIATFDLYFISLPVTVILSVGMQWRCHRGTPEVTQIHEDDEANIVSETANILQLSVIFIVQFRPPLAAKSRLDMHLKIHRVHQHMHTLCHVGYAIEDGIGYVRIVDQVSAKKTLE